MDTLSKIVLASQEYITGDINRDVYTLRMSTLMLELDTTECAHLADVITAFSLHLRTE